jgi:hypothetical protein
VGLGSFLPFFGGRTKHYFCPVFKIELKTSLSYNNFQ